MKKRESDEMVKLTAVLLKRALAENGIAHASRALVPELIELYDTIDAEIRQAFEAKHGINRVQEKSRIEDVSESDEGEDRDEEENADGDGENEENEESDESEGEAEDMAAIDAKLAMLRKKHEIMALRASIREMKQKAANVAAADAVTAAAAAGAATGINRNAVSTIRVENLPITSASTAEIGHERPPTFPVRLPEGLRTTPAPQAAVALPNNSHRIDYCDIEHAIIKFSGDDATHDVQTFLRSFEEMMQLISANETFRLLSLRRSFDGAAQILLHSTESSTYEGTE